MLKKMLHRVNTKAQWFGLRHITQKATVLSSRYGVIEPVATVLDAGFRLELMEKGQLVYVGFQDAADLQAAVDKAHDLVMRAAAFPLCHFTEQERPKAVGHYDQSRSVTIAEYKEWLHALHQTDLMLKASANIIDSHAFLHVHDCDDTFVASNGSEINQKYTTFLHTLKATASYNNVVQTRTNGSPCYQYKTDFLDASFMEKSAQKILCDVSELVTADNCPDDKRDVILHPDQLYLQIHESIGHPLELDRILGDERNYAGWSFVGLKDFGTLQYGSPLMNVTFDPSFQGETASYAFDDAGNPATKQYLIQDGLLKRPLGSLESQARSGLEGVANARSTSWNRPPLDRMANINLEKGTTSLDTMIASTERGIYMETNTSWSIDDYRRKFQFGCEYGRLIEDGRLTKVVRNPNYRGETLSFWHSLKAVGDESQVWGNFYCGKGEPNQVIQVGHATPHALFANLDVFGGQA